jgi:hypothetical protein
MKRRRRNVRHALAGKIRWPKNSRLTARAFARGCLFHGAAAA